MTLPKIFSLASKNFNNFDTLSFEAGTTTITNSLSHQEQQQPEQIPQQQQPQGLSSLNNQHSIMSSLPLIQTTTTLENATMFNANNTNLNLSPQQSISENSESQLLVECVMPGIYLTKDFISWKEEQLRSHGFTHIIIIDKHIQELYYPNQQPDIFKLCSMNNDKTQSLTNGPRRHDDSSSLNAFDYYCPPTASAANHLSFGKEFKVIDLNFGEKSYLTTVLPNCYRAVKFINKALQANGTILVIDCNGGEQKCLTIIVAYLMYKHHISFSNAFARLKEFYKKADLDRFYISQLYEYEPILQVQRAQSRGHSCSRELHAAILKRKKTHDDDSDATSDNSTTCTTPSSTCYNTTTSSYTNVTTTTELLDNCNPLNRFDSTQMERHEIKSSNHHNSQMTQTNRNLHTFTRFMSGTTLSSTTTGGWYNWDDYAME
ncbi:hypothetical protein FF38_00554 [Lucilia cuprina]|uniref:Dual specificity phosphatase catalytic domain-containing protein n=1 Tax=Lucilia cuprina TaxID=7375 RepID=A0A0L0CKN8_LUCCU|nr:hypothetical protein FF38_00554 [Lucilia cuprina]